MLQQCSFSKNKVHIKVPTVIWRHITRTINSYIAMMDKLNKFSRFVDSYSLYLSVIVHF